MTITSGRPVTVAKKEIYKKVLISEDEPKKAPKLRKTKEELAIAAKEKVEKRAALIAAKKNAPKPPPSPPPVAAIGAAGAIAVAGGAFFILPKVGISLPEFNLPAVDLGLPLDWLVKVINHSCYPYCRDSRSILFHNVEI